MSSGREAQGWEREDSPVRHVAESGAPQAVGCLSRPQMDLSVRELRRITLFALVDPGLLATRVLQQLTTWHL